MRYLYLSRFFQKAIVGSGTTITPSSDVVKFMLDRMMYSDVRDIMNETCVMDVCTRFSINTDIKVLNPYMRGEVGKYYDYRPDVTEEQIQNFSAVSYSAFVDVTSTLILLECEDGSGHASPEEALITALDTSFTLEELAERPFWKKVLLRA